MKTVECSNGNNIKILPILANFDYRNALEYIVKRSSSRSKSERIISEIDKIFSNKNATQRLFGACSIEGDLLGFMDFGKKGEVPNKVLRGLGGLSSRAMDIKFGDNTYFINELFIDVSDKCISSGVVSKALFEKAINLSKTSKQGDYNIFVACPMDEYDNVRNAAKSMNFRDTKIFGKNDGLKSELFIYSSSFPIINWSSSTGVQEELQIINR